MLRYVEEPPRHELRPYVECVWQVAELRPRRTRGAERVVPDGCPELIVHLADPFARRVGGRWVQQPRAFLAGPLSRPWQLRAGPRVLTVGVRFRPGAATAAYAVELRTAADREVPLVRLAGRGAAAGLLAELRRARTRRARLRAVEAHVLARIQASDGRGRQARQAVQLMLASGGLRRVEAIAQALGWSRRRLERTFARDVGLRPKLFARIVRLNAVLAGLDAAERPTAVDLALAAGYFDQAHLLRDFRSLVGRTPRARREGDGELARHFTHPERLRALLAGD